MPPPAHESGRSEELLGAALRVQQQSICRIMSEWMKQHKQMYEAHVAEQQRLISALQDVQQQTLERIDGLGFPMAGAAGQSRDEKQAAALLAFITQTAGESLTAGHGPAEDLQIQMDGSLSGSLLCQEQPEQKVAVTSGAGAAKASAPESDLAGAAGGSVVSAVAEAGDPGTKDKQVTQASRDAPQQLSSEDAASAVDFDAHVSARMQNVGYDEEVLSIWRRCSGMHTVAKWVKNYRRHPAGWAALLLIHGIPEITARLRSKVDNYAIYSALFLSMSMPLLMDPPDILMEEQTDDDWWMWTLPVSVRVRTYAHILMVGNACHMVSILLAMSFNNALNEAARDSDIFRMFSAGQGFRATVKCQVAFRLGCVADFVALIIAASCYTSVFEIFVSSTIVTIIGLRIYATTASKLMRSVSIVSYWRTELGGKPHDDDPFDISTPISCFDERCHANHELFKPGKGMFTGDDDKVHQHWIKLRETAGSGAGTTPHVDTSSGNDNLRPVAIGALF